MSPAPSQDSPAEVRPTKLHVPGLEMRWSWRWAVAFLALVLVLHELHELAHTWTGRLVCGGWGTRDFNTWSLVAGCEAWTPTAMGPLFTYLVLWAGAGLLLRPDRGTRLVGLALLFGANPLARLLTVGLGGGDELVVALAWSGGDQATGGLWTATVAVVVAVCAPPLVVGWRALRPTPRRGAWFAGLFLGPTVAVLLILLIGMNSLLEAGVLATPMILGEPPLVLLTTLVAGGTLLATRRWLLRVA